MQVSVFLYMPNLLIYLPLSLGHSHYILNQHCIVLYKNNDKLKVNKFSLKKYSRDICSYTPSAKTLQHMEMYLGKTKLFKYFKSTHKGNFFSYDSICQDGVCDKIFVRKWNQKVISEVYHLFLYSICIDTFMLIVFCMLKY